jgi:flagellar operon protein
MDEIQKTILFSKLHKVDSRISNTPSASEAKQPSTSFDAVLDSATLSFSKHAEKRLVSRNIELSSEQKGQLQSAMGSLEKKGARDSLILMGELAFVVNVPSKTVVTALTKDQMKEQVFTNIDSTMLVNS